MKEQMSFLEAPGKSNAKERAVFLEQGCAGTLARPAAIDGPTSVVKILDHGTAQVVPGVEDGFG